MSNEPTVLASKQCKYCMADIPTAAVACKFCTRDQRFAPPNERIQNGLRVGIGLWLGAILAMSALVIIFGAICCIFGSSEKPNETSAAVTSANEVDMSSVMTSETGFSVGPDVLCGVNLPAYERALQMQIDGNDKGYSHMLSTKKVMELPQGTKVLVLSGEFNRIKVRVLSGKFTGREVYLNRNELLHQMPDLE